MSPALGRLSQMGVLRRGPGVAVARLLSTLHEFRGQRRDLVVASFRGVVFWFAVVISQSIFMAAVGIHVPLTYSALVITTATAVTMVPISLGGLRPAGRGLRRLPHRRRHATAAQGAAVGVCITVQMLALGVIGIPFYLTLQTRRTAPAATAVADRTWSSRRPHADAHGVPPPGLLASRDADQRVQPGPGVGALGHEIDLVTYPVGQDRPVDAAQVRPSRVPGVHAVPVGPSCRKFVLNGAVTFGSLPRGPQVVANATTSCTPTKRPVCSDPCSPDSPRAARLRHGERLVRRALQLWVGPEQSDHQAGRLPGEHRHPAVGPASSPISRSSPPGGLGRDHAGGLDLQHLARGRPDPCLVIELSRRVGPADREGDLYSGTLEPYQGVPLLLARW